MKLEIDFYLQKITLLGDWRIEDLNDTIKEYGWEQFIITSKVEHSLQKYQYSEPSINIEKGIYQPTPYNGFTKDE